MSMRDLMEELLGGEPAADPMEAARKAMRQPLRKRFYARAEVTPSETGFAVRLDDKPVRTPARRALVAPSLPLAEAIAAEWEAQREVIDPARMPLTRLANTIIDGVAEAADAVAADVAKYLGSDLVFYRADRPEGLVARQQAAWDPVLAWAGAAFGARFVLAEGVMHVVQPEPAVAAVAGAIPADPWRLGALHTVTTLTGSALIALALAGDALTVDEAWSAAHVDEDWNMEQWGEDALALERRAARRAEMDAAATVLSLLR